MNQGVRNGIHPCGSAAATRQMLRDLFHPDYDRRLWHLTGSADPVPDAMPGRALAGSPSHIGIPPVGNFTPP